MTLASLTQTNPGRAADLTGRAVMVRLIISRWDAVRVDKQANKAIADKYGSDPTMADLKKSLIHPKALKAINAAADDLRAEHYRRTAPWLDGGMRVMAGKAYLEYVAAIEAKITLFEEEREKLKLQYPALVREAEVKLGGLFNRAEYPTVDELDRRFAAFYRLANIPSADDFRVVMSADETAAVKASIEAGAREGAQAAMASSWGKLKKVVEAMAASLRKYDPSGDKVEGVFRDSLTGNIKSLLEVVGSINITGDPAMDLFAERIQEELLAHDAQALRDSLATRNEIARKAESIVKAMSDFV